VKAIYEPKGRAKEYAPLACNLYSGCTHACRYCYVPAVLRSPREQFHDPANVRPRPGIIEALEKDARRLSSGVEPCGPVLLCFTCDPYPLEDMRPGVTRPAIWALLKHGIPVRILTKAPLRALDDFRTAGLHSDVLVEFGVTLAWADDRKRRLWEPNAESVADPENALAIAHGRGLRTWVSMEPVLDPPEALRVIDRNAPNVDLWRIGKLNHDRTAELAIDWRVFLREVLERLASKRARYVIKEDLWSFADASIRAGFSKSNVEEVKGEQ